MSGPGELLTAGTSRGTLARFQYVQNRPAWTPVCREDHTTEAGLLPPPPHPPTGQSKRLETLNNPSGRVTGPVPVPVPVAVPVLGSCPLSQVPRPCDAVHPEHVAAIWHRAARTGQEAGCREEIKHLEMVGHKTNSHPVNIGSGTHSISRTRGA